MLPLLAKPKALALKNRRRLGFDLRDSFGRDLVLAAFGSGVILAFYWGTLKFLGILSGADGGLYFPPALPLTAILFAVMIMLFFSNAAAALGAFVMSRDLDMLMASPISNWGFFWGKFVEVMLGSSWMVVVFFMPVASAFGVFFSAGPLYFAAAAAALPAFLAIPSAAAVIVTLSAACLLPAHRTKEALLAAFAGFLWCLYSAFKILLPSGPEYSAAEDLASLLAFFSRPLADGLPSNWAGSLLGEALNPHGGPWRHYLVLLYSTAIGLVSLAYAAFRLFHRKALSLNGAETARGQGFKRSPSALSRFVTGLDPQIGAVVGKDMAVFSRDLSQAVQLLLLLGLCAVYLYNFKIMHGVQNITDSAKIWWRGFLAASNIFMGAFVITAVCSRFVFPSISLEGQGFWIIQTAPIGVDKYLRAKFLGWLFPICFIASSIFAAGALISGSDPKIVLLHALLSWVLAYGIVGLAVGLGAVFANFDWEHPSQLAASFGSLVFMLAAAGLIILSLAPACAPIILSAMGELGRPPSEIEWWSATALSLGLLCWINFKAAAWALKTGEAAISSKSK